MKRADIANIPLPCNLYHPVHAATLPVATDDRDDLERLLGEGWYLSQDRMRAGLEPEGIDAAEEHEEEPSSEDETDPVDEMLNEEANADDTKPRAKKKNTKKK